MDKKVIGIIVAVVIAIIVIVVAIVGLKGNNEDKVLTEREMAKEISKIHFAIP